MTKGAQRLGLPTGGLSSKARLGSLCASRLHNVSVEWRGLTFYDFPFNGTELLLKREDNSSVTRFACATFPTREGKAAAPRPVIANQRADSPHVIARQCAHCRGNLGRGTALVERYAFGSLV